MKNNTYDTKHIKVLDGIRALAIMIIVWYHIWQQSWLSPTIGTFSLDFLPRYGFLLVDMMILLSSFCLFIPYARKMVYKEKMPKTRDFYIKRIARIMPSYYLSMVIALLFVIIFKTNWFNASFIKDTLMNIFFVQNWSQDVLIGTIYIGALWTVAIEMQYYLLFPFLAKMFTKKPILTYSIMMIIGVSCIYLIKNNVNSNNIRFYTNHFLTFIPIYANGMLASWLYIKYTKNRKRNKWVDIISTIISVAMIIAYVHFSKIVDAGNVQEWQLNHRIILSIVFTIFIISTALASKLYQKLYDNKLMKYIAVISFNLYIYHQFIAAKLKEFHIPYYSGNTPPNMLGDKKWQWTYTILCVIISLIVAIIMTYCVEKPLAKRIKKKLKCEQ